MMVGVNGGSDRARAITARRTQRKRGALLTTAPHLLAGETSTRRRGENNNAQHLWRGQITRIAGARKKKRLSARAAKIRTGRMHRDQIVNIGSDGVGCLSLRAVWRDNASGDNSSGKNARRITRSSATK